MRTLFIAIVVAAIGYLAFVSRDELQKAFRHAPALAGNVASPALAAREVPSAVQVPEAAPVAEFTPEPSAPVIAEASTTPPPPRIRIAPPGIYFLATRVSVTTDSGVIAILPGEEVKLMYRNKDGTVRVQWGKQDVIVPETQLSKKLDLATGQPIPTTVAAPLLGQRGN